MPDKSLSAAIASSKLPRFEAELLLSHILQKDRTWVIAHGDHLLTLRQQQRLIELVRQRRAHAPIAYLMSTKEFYGRAFHVMKDVLIPRPETELMIDLPLPLLRKECGLIVWDVGTGSGVIAITLATEYPHATILATDVSAKALAIAKKNARRYSVQTRITFLKNNLLQPTAYQWLKKHTAKKDSEIPALLICANLPYLPASDKTKLAPTVTRFEPATALYSGNNGLSLITRFLRQLSRHVPEWGYSTATLLFEFDPPQSHTIQKLARMLFPNALISIHKDLAGRNRVLQIIIN